MRSGWKFGVGLVWAVGGVLAIESGAVFTDDPMDPAFGVAVGAGKAPGRYRSVAEPDRGRALASGRSRPSRSSPSLPTSSSRRLSPIPWGRARGRWQSPISTATGGPTWRSRTSPPTTYPCCWPRAPARFSLPSISPPATSRARSRRGDLNGDGLPDLVVSNRNSIDLSVLLADGHGGFDPAMATRVSEEPGALAVVDLDGDGAADVVVTFPESDRVAVLLGRGDGSLRANTQFVTGRAPVSVAVADLDGDGALDVVTANRVSNDVSVLRGAGDGTFLSDRRFAAGIGPFHVVGTDMDGNGTTDLVVADYDGNSLALLLGDGSGAFAAPTMQATGAGPSWVAPGDFNADGTMDLAVVNFAAGNVMVFAGDGAGAVFPAATLAAGPGPRALAAQDLDDDGRIDLVTAQRDDNSVAWYLNEGPFPYVVPPTAVAAADSTHECTSSAGALVRLDGSASYQDNGELVRFEWLLGGDKPLAEGSVVDVELPLGSSAVTLRVTDATGETATDSVDVVVEDTTAPTLSVTPDPAVLAPANHKMVPVHATVEAADLCGDVTTVLVSVVSDQPDDAPLGHDGHTVNDIQGAVVGTADFDFELRAEHDVRDESGRSYAVTYKTVDASGNVIEVRRLVVVPYDETASSDEEGTDRPDDPSGDDDDDDDDDWGERDSPGDDDDDDDDDDHWTEQFGDDDDDDD